MFNIKRIGIAFSVLALVGLTGALMSGSAFAHPKQSDHEKDITCHYQEMVTEVLEVTDPVTGAILVEGVKGEEEAWKVINNDPKSRDSHAAHGDEMIYDGLLKVPTGFTVADCEQRDADLV